MLKNRLISSFFLMLATIAVLFLLPPIGFSIVVFSICMLASLEWIQFISDYNSKFFKCILLLIIFSCLFIIMAFLLLGDHYRNAYKLVVSSILWTSLVWWIIALLLVIFYPESSIILRYSRVLHLVSGLLTIIPFFSGMLIFRIWRYDENHYNGSQWLFYIMLLVWGSDSGAFILGKLFGKHKLVPKISPKKTWQGFIGGLMIATSISLSYNALINVHHISQSKLIISSIVIILSSVLGDLTESMFKREAGIKDSGRLIPGHGGVLDRIDSLMAAVPIFGWLLFQIFKTT